MNDYFSEEKEQYENTQSGGKGKKTLISPDGKINTPEFLSTSKTYKGKTSYK